MDLQPILELPHLHILSISKNPFSSFHTKDLLLNKPSNLKVLDISDSSFETFSISMPIFPFLETIELSSSYLKWDTPNKTLLQNITAVLSKRSKRSFRVSTH